MNFGLSEEQELLQETVRGFVAKECPASRVHDVFAAEGRGDPGLWRDLVEMGVSGLAVPESFGGAGLTLLECALVAEVLGHGAVPVPFLEHTLAALALTLGGSPSQQERWLPRLAAGDALGTVAFAEANGAWEPERWTPRV